MHVAAFLALLAAAVGQEQAASIPKDAAKLVAQADREFRNDRADAALKLYTEALSLEKAPKTYYARHKIYLKKGKLQAAIKDLSTAIELDATYSMAYLQRANLYLTMGRCEDASSDYKKTLALDPNKKDAQVRLPQAQACAAALVRADVAERNKNWPAALSALTDAMADGRATSSPALFLRRARVHLEMKGLEQAMVDSGKAIKLDSSNALAYALRGRILQQHGDYSTAKAHFGECMETDPDVQVWVWA
jgi:tetratricopeptide (TPR) repeat protein